MDWIQIPLLASFTSDIVLYKIVLLVIGIIISGAILKLLNQPIIIAYITAGVILGKHGMGIIVESSILDAMGSFGLILLLFFIGMEISLPKLFANWKTSVFGTLFQVLASILITYVLGIYYGWNATRIIMIGFVISLSSTSVIVKMLQDSGEMDTNVGQNALGVLLVQDIIIIPMLIVIHFLSGEEIDPETIIKQLTGGVLIVASLAYVIRKKRIRIPFQRLINKDHELQVFLAIALCFGFSFITSWFSLSAALGAFVAGIMVSSVKATKWVHESLHSFRIVFVAVFFISIGLMIDLKFIKANLSTIFVFVFLVLVVNNLINAITMRIFKQGWRDSIYIGAILAQIGEFSFILGSTGYLLGIISENAYNLIISIISISLVASPIWINLIKHLVKPTFGRELNPRSKRFTRKVRKG